MAGRIDFFFGLETAPSCSVLTHTRSVVMEEKDVLLVSMDESAARRAVRQVVGLAAKQLDLRRSRFLHFKIEVKAGGRICEVLIANKHMRLMKLSMRLTSEETS